MGWKVSVAIVLATIGLPAAVAAEAECQQAPAGFNAIAQDDLLLLTWNLPPDCPDVGDGMFQIFRNGELIATTAEMNHTTELVLPVAYTLVWQSASSEGPSDPSTLLLLADDPGFTPFIKVANVDAFVQYLATMSPCMLISWGSQPHIPYLFDIAWNCLPLGVDARVIFV